MRCREVVELASDHIDGTVPRPTSWRLRAHLAVCDHCSRFVRQLALTRDLVRRLPAPAVEPTHEDELVSVLLASRRDGLPDPAAVDPDADVRQRTRTDPPRGTKGSRDDPVS